MTYLLYNMTPFYGKNFGEVFMQKASNNKSFFKDKSVELKVFSKKRLQNYFQNVISNNEPKKLINCDHMYGDDQNDRKRYELKRFRIMKKIFDDFESNVIKLTEELENHK